MMTINYKRVQKALLHNPKYYKYEGNSQKYTNLSHQQGATKEKRVHRHSKYVTGQRTGTETQASFYWVICVRVCVHIDRTVLLTPFSADLYSQ